MYRFIFILMLIPMSVLVGQSTEATQSNRRFWEETHTTAEPQAIWKIWTDVPKWKEWDTGLADAELEGNFRLHAHGRIQSLQGRWSKFTVSECESGQSYTITTKLPLAALHVRRSLTRQGDQTTFRHEVWFTGVLGGLFAKLLAPDFRKMLPEVVLEVKRLAER